MPHKYDHRGNLASTIHNFKVINKEHPVQIPKITGSSWGDTALKMLLTNKYSPISKMKTAFDLGYIGAGYYDNFKRAYNESHRYDNMLDFSSDMNK